ncbi:MAG: ATP-binding protein [Bacteroidota bacterium]
MSSLAENNITTLNRILVYLAEGNMDTATELFNKSEPESVDDSPYGEFTRNFRQFIRQYLDGAVFLKAITNGNLDVDPPDDPHRQNFVIAQFKQLHSNLRHITWQAQQIAKGDLKQKVSFLGEFSIAFNTLIESLREKKLMEEKIRIQVEQLQLLNAEKDKFFSIIAHDLRNPLGGFMGLTELMRDQSGAFTPEEERNMIISLSNSARNIFNLLENLLEWSQMQRGGTMFNPQKLVIKAIVNECTETAAESALKKAIEIAVNVPEELVVFADTNMLQTVIRNLVSNAIKFTRHGGRVSVSAHRSQDNSVFVEVEDTGIGMSTERLNTLFRIDVHNSRPGTEGEPSTGLGLLLCKEFVEKHGGKLRVKSEEGKGSAIGFNIPQKTLLEDKRQLSDSHSTATTGNGMLNLKVLIVEDDETSGRLIDMAVQLLGKEVLKARSGAEAIEACLKHPDIDLVLMDIKMPGMDGYEATRRIRQFNQAVVIVAQTAFGLTGYREKALEAGCDDYISKPLDVALLKQLIEKHFKDK